MGQGKTIISVSYGNYLMGIGGTDKVILAHQKMFNNKGYTYIFIYPYQKIWKLFPIKSKNEWGVVWDGRKIFIKETKALVKWLEKNFKEIAEIHIHHLRYVEVNELNYLLTACSAKIRFFLHDYYSICTNYNLLYNDKFFCGSGSRTIKKCNGCKYFHQKTSEMLFEDFFCKWKKRITLIAPSDTAKKIWADTYPEFKNAIIIIPHQILLGHYDQNIRDIKPNDIIRVAYVGGSLPIKGYNQWKELIKRVGQKEKYEFFHFGNSTEHLENVTLVKVDFKNNLNAMIDALRRYKIDCAILWSVWPETYAYTYYECMASNIYIITNIASGNISKQIWDNGQGLVLKQEEELYSLFQDSNLLQNKINKARANWKKGPEKLEENTAIIDLVEKSVSNPIIVYNHRVSIKIKVKDYFLTLLNLLGVFYKKNINR